MVAGAHPARRGHARRAARDAARLPRPGRARNTGHDRFAGGRRAAGGGHTSGHPGCPRAARAATDLRKRADADHTDRVDPRAGRPVCQDGPMTRGLRMALALTLALTGCGTDDGTASYTMDGQAMEPTIAAGQQVTGRGVPAGGYEPRHGDIVVLRRPDGWRTGSGSPDVLVRRVIAVGGEHVACCDVNGRSVRVASSSTTRMRTGSPSGRRIFTDRGSTTTTPPWWCCRLRPGLAIPLEHL